MAGHSKWNNIKNKKGKELDFFTKRAKKAACNCCVSKVTGFLIQS